MQIARDVEMELGGDFVQLDSIFPASHGYSFGSSGRVSTNLPTSKDFGPVSSLGASKQLSHWASSWSNASPAPGHGHATSSPASSQMPSTSVANVGPQRRVDNDRRYMWDKACSVNHLSYQELLDRKAKGLCFRWGDKFHPLHQCPNRSLWVMLLEEDEPQDESGGLLAIEATVSEGK